MIKRYPNNPIIKIEDIKPSKKQFEVIGVFNAGVTTFGDEVILILRIAERVKSKKGVTGVPYFDKDLKKINVLTFKHNDDTIDFKDPRWIKTRDQAYLTSISHFRLARSKDGIHFNIDEKPWLVAKDYYESFGVEDPRVSKIGETYYINYTAVSPSGTVTKLISTKDFKRIKRHGIIFMADNKDVAIIPEKINGEYYVINRPTSESFKRPEMWISKSKNLTAYYGHKLLAAPRIGLFDSGRIGASCVPFKTKHGWLEIYHGATKDNHYCLGVMLLDLEDPSKIIAWSKEPIMLPEASYETHGFMPNVVFTCGCYVKDDVVHIYYGAADETLCYATVTVADLFKHLVLKY